MKNKNCDICNGNKVAFPSKIRICRNCISDLVIKAVKQSIDDGSDLYDLPPDEISLIKKDAGAWWRKRKDKDQMIEEMHNHPAMHLLGLPEMQVV